MSKKNLMEAAAEILAASKSSAPKAPPQKLEGSDAINIGGPTPEETEKEKLNATAGVPSATPPGKPAPVGAEPMHKLSEEKDDDADDKDDDKDDKDSDDDKDDDKKEDMHESWKKSLKEDVDAILKEESTLSPEFRTKVATIYEARVTDKVNQIVEELEAKFAKQFETDVLELQNTLAEKIDSYLDYVVEEWMKENEVAIESGLRAELTEEFIGGLKNLFAEHYIDVPEEKVDIVEELAGKVADLETQLNAEIARGIEQKKALEEAKKNEILQSVCEGLVQTQVEKVRSLAESVEFTAEGEYKSKIETIRENYFPKNNGKPADAAKVLTETLESESTEKKPVIDSRMQAYVKTLQGTLAN